MVLKAAFCLHKSHSLSVTSGVPTKHATYQIVLPIIYVYCFKGKFRLRVGMEIKKASNHTKKRLVAQSDR